MAVADLEDIQTTPYHLNQGKDKYQCFNNSSNSNLTIDNRIKSKDLYLHHIHSSQICTQAFPINIFNNTNNSNSKELQDSLRNIIIQFQNKHALVLAILNVSIAL